MPQLFRRKSNAIYRLALLAFFCFGVALVFLGEVYKWSSYETEVGAPLLQPVPFSHQHHIAGLGLDCRYCHTSVEVSATAGMPPTKTCMTCHSQIWQQAPMLKPIRDSFRDQNPIQWNRVYRLPRYVYFNHSIHVQKGIGCTSCHGPIQKMPLTWKAQTFYMRECLSCHREPEKQLRPKDQVFNVEWKAPPDQIIRGKKLARDYHTPKQRLTDCYTCHR